MSNNLNLCGSDEEVMQYLAQFIKEKRIELEISQSSISRASGVDNAYISRIERGKKHRITVYMLVRILNALNLEIVIKEKKSKRKRVRR
ncbi:helix-turn-helix domain-containing protein [Flagellimonas nanhaiensis]|uniref:XRE family transcriptional regulator n=1 Tax=Flagellimonas nanhaiensis TaxID=2292706 RepID=A0A371JLS5_9FLAO|nr:helix-turn-helix transcriptional regulator [Allomuricauda nanhaiensis]RDY58015.1 XRE family transcriptional regulator [Allomuricauda nanhaiensis]